VAPGNYRIIVGGGLPKSQAPSIATAFTIHGRQKLPD
jgi:hypothetical protein